MKNRDLLISATFFTYLKRPPNTVELQYWLSAISPDMSVESFEREFEQEFRYEITLTSLCRG